jgi:hypothetical protein
MTHQFSTSANIALLAIPVSNPHIQITTMLIQLQGINALQRTSALASTLFAIMSAVTDVSEQEVVSLSCCPT